MGLIRSMMGDPLFADRASVALIASEQCAGDEHCHNHSCKDQVAKIQLAPESHVGFDSRIH
jgi:hypothetical protein